MVANKTFFSKLFFVASFCFIFPIYVSADFYGEGTYGSERYSGNNSTTTAPNAPTSLVATAGNAQVTISFIPPANNGGSAITSYVVTSSPGDITAAGLSSPIIVTGLTNGIAYTFTMTAINSVGTSSTSTVSNSVTPIVPSNPAPQTSGGGGGGGSTSGSSYIPTSLTNTNTVTETVVKEPVNTNTQNVQTVVFSFDKNISTGVNNNNIDVKTLQQFLNKNGYIVSTTGSGSIGNETTYFGPATQAALIKFQKANNISPAVGYFGPLTRNLINSLLNTSDIVTNNTSTSTISNTSNDTSTTTTQTYSYNRNLKNDTSTTTTQTYSYNRNLKIDMEGDDVRILQQFLNKNGYIVSTTGSGSIGNETTYFGPATQAALIKFQKANNISPAVGYFGPITKELVESLSR